MDKQLELYLSFRNEGIEQARSSLGVVGATNIERIVQSGATGVEITFIATLASYALSNLIMKLLPLWKCGVIVDARGAKVTTAKDCNLPPGTVLIISKCGTQTKLDRPSDLQLEPLIKAAASQQS